MKIILENVPLAQMRHRLRRIGSRVTHYDPMAEKKEEVRYLLAKSLLMQTGNKKNDEEASFLRYKDFYHVSFVFTFPIPKSDRKGQKKLKLDGLSKHTQAPDLDNLEKFYLDSMTGVLFSDDKKVIKLQSEKRWGEAGSVEIEIVGFNECSHE